MPKSILTDRSGQTQDCTRISLLNQAAKLFIIKGYHGTSIADITDACHLTKSSFFHHFASKETVALGVIAFMQHYCEKNIFMPLWKNSLSAEGRVALFIEKIKLHLFQQADNNPIVGFVGVELIDALDSIKLAIQDYFKDWLKNIRQVSKPFYKQTELPNLASCGLAYLQGSLTVQRIYPDQSLAERTCQYLSKLWMGKQLTTPEETLAN